MHFYFKILLCFIINDYSYTKAVDTWEFDNAPGVTIEYKIHVDAGKEDCYWQYVREGSVMYVNMQVIKGGDGMAAMAIRNPRNEILHSYNWKASDEFEAEVQMDGYYSICIDNQYSRFAAKLVNLYLTTFRNDLWEKYTKELEDMNVSVMNVTMALRKVDENIHHILQYQSVSRSKEGRDLKLLIDNNDYIQYWSVAQCFAIMCCTALQVYSVRRLFETKNPKSGYKS